VANLALVFDILAKDNASGPFKNVGNAAERAGQQTSKFGTAMSGAFKLASGALLGAGLVAGFKALYNAADESRKITNLTAQVIKSTGGAANVSAKQVGDLAAAIAKKTGVDDEAIQSGENLLLTFTNVKNVVGSGNDIFNRATKVITDMSVALGQDTSSSAIQLGKALNDPIKGVTALQRVGVSFTASQKDQIKTLVESGRTLDAQKLILAELGKEFGGAAEAAATPLGKLQQRLGDLAEQVGGYLIPLVDKPRRSSTTSCCRRSRTPVRSSLGSSSRRSRRSLRSSVASRTCSTHCLGR
jgi:phage-related minor tail protein